MKTCFIPAMKVLIAILCLAASAQELHAQVSTQILDPAMRQTVDQPTWRPKDSSLVAFNTSDTSYYYETPVTYIYPGQTMNWYGETGTTYWQGGYARRVPKTSTGSANGATANYKFDISTAGNYLVYTYVCYTFSVTDNAYMSVKSAAATLDSARCNLLQPGTDVPRYINLALVPRFTDRANDGAWLPVCIANAPAGNKAITVTIGADTLTAGPLRVDAVRILRSSAAKDLEFGRRNRVAFDSMRVPESYRPVNIGGISTRQFRFYNLGTSVLGLFGITSTNGQFQCTNSFPIAIQPGTFQVVTINFKPTKSGTLIDTLIVTSDDPAEPTAKWIAVGDASNPLWLTVDQPPGVQAVTGQYVRPGVDTSYFETLPIASPPNLLGNDGLYNNTGTASWGGLSRLSPNAAGGGSPNGASGNYTFDLPVTTNYLIYVYLRNDLNNSANHLLLVRRFGEGGAIADSVRFSGISPGANVPNFIARGLFTTFDSTYSTTQGKYIPNGGADGAWMPLSCVPLFAGNDAVTVTWAADALTPAYFRFDAVRILRSTLAKDLEFGRREKIGFLDSRRVPEMFPQTTLGEYSTKLVRFWSLGSQPVTVSSITGSTRRFSSGTTFPVTIQPGKYADIALQFAPFQEEETTDTLTVVSDDSAEPNAKLVVIGEGINWNFILNASAGGVEPHYNAPGTSSSQNYSGAPYWAPIYSEIPSTWLNSGINGLYDYPLPGGNLKSRVYVGSGFCEARFKFIIPPVKSGIYRLEYNGPPGDAYAGQNVTVELMTPFRSDTQRVTGFNEVVPGDRIFTAVGDGYPFAINGGDTTTTRWSNLNDGNTNLLRMDLLRIRKIPTKATLSVNPIFDFGNISINDSIRRYQQNFRHVVAIRSAGEMSLRLVQVRLTVGTIFKLVNAPPANWELSGINGIYNLSVDCTPDSIRNDYVDTLFIASTAPGDSIRRVLVHANGVGTQVAVDNSDAASVFITPNVVAFDAADPVTQTKWQRLVDPAAAAGDRLLARIYKTPGAIIEWFPTIPLLTKPIGTVDYFTVSVKSNPFVANATPRARYIVREAGGVIDTFLVNQNNLTGEGEFLLGAGKVFAFRRGGQDTHGASAIYGYVRLENDTALVSGYYAQSGNPNFARDSGYYINADRITLNEVKNPTLSVKQDNSIPTSFALSQNYPNPFNPTTDIRFALPTRNVVSLVVYDILGREVTRLIDQDAMAPGNYSIRWNAQTRAGMQVSTGVYFYRITAGDFVLTKKMLLLK